MKSDMDNREWLNDYPLLKQVGTNNPFTVPDGYFDELSQRTMSRAVLDGVSAAAGAGFTVPENYFEELPGNLQSRIVVETALENSALGFSVPVNYFEDMQANLQSRINIEEALHHAKGDFTVPADYFEDQHQQIIGSIAVDEILNNKPDGFTVPDGYFNRLQKDIINKTASPVVKRDAIVRRLIHSSAFKYATAACITIAVGATVFFTAYESPEAVHKRSYIHKALDTVPDADIIDYLQNHLSSTDTPTLMDAADHSDIGIALQDSLSAY